MLISRTFDEFVKKEVAQAEDLKAYNEINWPRKLETWRGEVEGLLSKMERYLKVYIDDGKINAHREPIELSEPNVGSYDTEELILKIGIKRVVARPMGMQLIGAKGQVDLIGPRGIIRIALLERGGPKREVAILEFNQFVEDNGGFKYRNSDIDKQGWYITSPPPDITVTALNKETFQEAIMELADV